MNVLRSLFSIFRSDRDGEWHFHNYRLMRRYVGGKYVYRQMTLQESAEYQSYMAW